MSPALIPLPPVSTALAWAVSVIGWLLMPALVGAVVGYLVNMQIGRHRSLATPPGGSLAHGA
ncbi:DUF6313 family protein [Mycetocola tolaasinivorans]